MKMPTEEIDAIMFAPCGMNCKVCYKHCYHKKPWELTMTDEAGTSKKETGSLCADLLVGGNGISQVLRELLPIENMFLFDENCGDEDEQE